MLFYLFSLGCKVNSYENDALRKSLLERGDEEANGPEEASLIVINTCSVTGKADQKSRQHIRKMRRLAPKAVIAVMGCYSELHADEALSMGADIVVGTSDRSKILGFVDSFRKDGKKIKVVEKNNRHEKYEEMGQMALSENARAYLKIQDGCDNFCSYCLIPFLRGNSRSRDKDETIAEAKRLSEAGYKELIISGIHIGMYGKDLGDGSYRLADLLKDILLACPKLKRLRISSLEESEIDDKFLDLLRDFPQIVDHLHLPLQSGSPTVLQRMKRHYDTPSFLLTLSKVRAIRPDIAITTDVIVGFPLESDKEWQETMDFCKKAKFSEIHVFPYSPREGTYSYTLKDTSPEVKEKRVHELLDLSNELRQAYEERFYGKKMEVLFEDFDERNSLCYGHTANYLLVKVASKRKLHGEILDVIYDKESAAD